MTDRAAVAEAIQRAPQEASQALMAVQLGTSDPITMAGIAVAAKHLQRDVADLAAEEIERRDLLDPFAMAMRGLGIAIDGDPARLADANFPDEASEFLARARAFRCRVYVDRSFRGSGCLVSPSLVLTAWHVIAEDPKAKNGSGPPQIEVQLSDGAKQRAHPEPVYFSQCTKDELDGTIPEEAKLRGFDDVALLRLDRPHGMRLGFSGIPPKPIPMLKSRSSILLLHFPNGTNRGIGTGKVAKYRGITSRWKHDVAAAAGSSGGACFDTRLDLAGVHQGKWVPEKRLVPASLFVNDRVRELIEADIAPPALWSLDGTISGPLVIGRDLFFEAIAGATRSSTRVRGLRIKRTDPARSAAGLANSLEMLTLTLARNPGTHRTIRVNFETPVDDLLDDIARRAGAPAAAPSSGAGVRLGETTLEATLNDRARNLAAQIDADAEREEQLVWFLFESPPAGLSDGERFAFEAFIASAMREPRLRLVLAGFETMTTPGDEFPNAQVEGEGAPGLVVEFIGDFSRRDVELLFERACESFGVPPKPDVIAHCATQVLRGLTPTNGAYAAADLDEVRRRAIGQLEQLRPSHEAAGS